MLTLLRMLFFQATLLQMVAIPAEAQSDPDGSITEAVSDAAGGLAYRLYLPAGGGRGRPLLVMLHGCTQDAADFAIGTRMNEWAERRGFSVLYPEPSPGANPQRCWSWFDPAHQRRGSGEVAGIAALTREIAVREGADAERIYIGGISAGAAMALLAAANYPELFGGVASHSGIAVGAATDLQSALKAMRDGWSPPADNDERLIGAIGASNRIVRLISFQGGGDPVVNAANADGLVRQWTAALARISSTPLDVSVQETQPLQHRPAMRRIWKAGDATVVEQWTIGELGHAWSGGSSDGTYTDPAGPDATAEIVRFFFGPAEHERAR